MCYYSEKCIDERAGFDKDLERKTLVPRKYGRWVYCLKTCNEILSERHKHLIN